MVKWLPVSPNPVVGDFYKKLVAESLFYGACALHILWNFRGLLLAELNFSGRRGGVLHLLGAVPRAAPPLRHVLPLRVEVRLRGDLPGQSVGHQTRNVVVQRCK